MIPSSELCRFNWKFAKPTMNDSAKLREILEQSPAGVSIITRDRFDRLFINSRMIELLGIEGREDTPGIETFVHAEDYNQVMRLLAEGVVINDAEYERRRVDDGRIWWSLMHARPTEFEGRQAGIVWLYDISKRKVAETKLQQLTSIQSDWLWEIDQNLDIVSFSENFYAMSGYAPSQIEGVGMKEWGRMSNASPATYDKFLETLEARQPVRNIEFERLDDSGSKWVRINAAPIRDGDAFKGYYGSTTDITELRKTQERLTETERAAALGGMVAGVAHEINTPLGVSVTALSIMAKDGEETNQAFENGKLAKSDLVNFFKGFQENIGILDGNLQRAANLVRNFKQVAVDQTSDQPRRINLYDYVEQIIASLSPRFKSTSHQIMHEGERNAETDTYPGAIAQIITNLLENSLNHAYEDNDAGILKIAIEKTAHEIRLIYSDDGKGMAPDVVKRIFEPFFTTARGQGGSGLGMHIVHNLVVQRLMGTIDCHSQPGKGMTVEITFPA